MTDHRVDKAKGRIKEAAGALTGNRKLKEEGKADQAASSVKEKVEDAVDTVKDTVTDRDKK